MKKYNLTDSQIRQIANLAVQENGEACVAYEVSLMANLFELQTKYSDIYKFIRYGKWFSRSEYWMDEGTSSKKARETTKDVLVNGNRVFPAYINEHDCISDIKSVTNKGVLFNKSDRSQYKKDVTVIKNRYGSTYTFYSFPTTGSDPFGYTADAYKKISAQSPKTEVKHATTKTTGASPDKVIEVASNEVGYLEKASNSQLDSKTGNAGQGNYTKYWTEMDKSLQGQAWCDCFVSFCFKQAYSESVANKLLCGGLYSFYTPESAACFKNKGQWHDNKPQKGDVIYFHNSERICHTGIVYKVDSETVYTIEGNTSAGEQVIPNGGGVCKKSYRLYNPRISGYGRPKYDSVSSESASQANNTGTPTLNETVKKKGVVTAKSLNVRTWAGTENPTVSFSPIKDGAVVGICDTLKDASGREWYYIKYQNKYGFVCADYVDDM